MFDSSKWTVVGSGKGSGSFKKAEKRKFRVSEGTSFSSLSRDQEQDEFLTVVQPRKTKASPAKKSKKSQSRQAALLKKKRRMIDWSLVSDGEFVGESLEFGDDGSEEALKKRTREIERQKRRAEKEQKKKEAERAALKAEKARKKAEKAANAPPVTTLRSSDQLRAADQEREFRSKGSSLDEAGVKKIVSDELERPGIQDSMRIIGICMDLAPPVRVVNPDCLRPIFCDLLENVSEEGIRSFVETRFSLSVNNPKNYSSTSCVAEKAMLAAVGEAKPLLAAELVVTFGMQINRTGNGAPVVMRLVEGISEENGILARCLWMQLLPKLTLSVKGVDALVRTSQAICNTKPEGRLSLGADWQLINDSILLAFQTAADPKTTFKLAAAVVNLTLPDSFFEANNDFFVDEAFMEKVFQAADSPDLCLGTIAANFFVGSLVQDQETCWNYVQHFSLKYKQASERIFSIILHSGLVEDLDSTQLSQSVQNVVGHLGNEFDEEVAKPLQAKLEKVDDDAGDDADVDDDVEEKETDDSAEEVFSIMNVLMECKNAKKKKGGKGKKQQKKETKKEQEEDEDVSDTESEDENNNSSLANPTTSPLRSWSLGFSYLPSLFLSY